MHITVSYQQSEGVAALRIPKERLEAIAHHVAEIGITDDHWSHQPSFTLPLNYRWGSTPMTLIVKRDCSQFDVLFITDAEAEKAGFRKSKEEADA